MIRKNISHLFGYKDIDGEETDFQKGKKVRLNSTYSNSITRKEEICHFDDDRTSTLSANDQISITESNVSPVQDFFSYCATSAINNNNFTSGSAKDTVTVPSTCADQSIHSISERSTYIPPTSSSYHSDLNYLDHPSQQQQQLQYYHIVGAEDILPSLPSDSVEDGAAVMIELIMSDNQSFPSTVTHHHEQPHQQQLHHNQQHGIRKNSSWGWFVFTEDPHHR